MKTYSLLIFFVGLIIILFSNPRVVNKIYSSILGRLCLISVVVLLSMKSVSLGLLVALTIIASSAHFGSFVEGLENMEYPTTVGEENIPITGKQVVLTSLEKNDAKKNASDLKTNEHEPPVGVDKESIKTAIMSKESNTIQTDPNMMTNENVEAFTSTMLKPSTLTYRFNTASLVA